MRPALWITILPHRGPRPHKRSATQARSTLTAGAYTRSGLLAFVVLLLVLCFWYSRRNAQRLTELHHLDPAHGDGGEVALMAPTHIPSTHVTTVHASYFSLAGRH
jgi:hypothetical protein